MQTPLEQALVFGIVLLNAYSFGANCVERFVNYQTWPLIAAASFTAYHKAQQPLIQAFVVAPIAVGFVLQIWFLRIVPVAVNPMVPWVMIIASAVGAVSTVTLQLPIHAALNRDGYSPALMRKLLRTDWIRKGADVVRLAATVVLMHQIVSAH
ncbi:hypothetical protein RBB75_11395 [Tunturibacter empetritectus]|uniref:DUF1772 domain-containing protein n=1 Tax=Tunturiibacter empetritectus TaxID=3069691 RepID=A0AAU7Z7Z9_9BACT